MFSALARLLVSNFALAFRLGGFLTVVFFFEKKQIFDPHDQ